ncbi:MAG: hypothetical protein WC318_07185 [Candidatus Omnitrophota bacterium]|jgi:hypothetical protein
MPTHDFVDIGDVLKNEFLEGEIVTVSPSDDTCTVNIAGSVYPALLFWHSLPTSNLRDNGAIYGAAENFVAGDSVIVMKKVNALSIGDCKVIYGGSKSKILLQKLVVYQNQNIARADNFPNDYLLYNNIIFNSENCDISWSYRQQKYIVVCPSWVKLVGMDGTVSKTYTLSNSEGYIIDHVWQWNRELWLIRTSPTTYITLDHEFNLIASGIYDFIGMRKGWWDDQVGGKEAPFPMYLVESRCDMSNEHLLYVVRTANWEDIIIDQLSGQWGKWDEVESEWTFDDGSWPKDSEGNLVSESEEQEYYWCPDHKHDPYTGAQLRLYTISTMTYVVLYNFPMVDYNFVNTIEFDTCLGIEGGGGWTPPIQY